ncbi:MAG TPA: hypothetical protein VHX49_05530 [Candidatus Acidoferrales bacterium]|jgi:hypothetical protein|nr:hypothetical protein [Candidatus Acidoferrales bacterium]
MGDILANRIFGGSRGTTRAGKHLARFAALCVALAFLGCHNVPPLDTTPLDNAGMSYDAENQLKALGVTAPEVAQVAAMRRAGFDDAACIQVFGIFHGRNQKFDAGDAIAGLAQAGMSQDTIVKLAQLNQLGLMAGELQAMRLAGLSDEIILEVAQHHAAGQSVLGGVSLATMQNAGMRESTLLELVRHSVPDSQADAILAFRRHGANDKEILKHFGGS